MINSQNKMGFRMLFLIATPKLENKAVKLFKEGNVPVQYHLRAQGRKNHFNEHDAKNVCG